MDHFDILFAKTYIVLYKRIMIVKFLEISKDKDAPQNRVSFIASTESPDRYGDVISQRGWQLESYKKNPIVLLNHDSGALPIGKGIVNLKNGQLVIDVEFDMDDPLAANVARKAKNGFINAVSVGFQPLESVLRRELDPKSPLYGTKGQYFKRSELLEVSIVTIPANSEATMLGKMNKSSISESILKKYIEELVVEKVQEKSIIQKQILDVEETEKTIIVTYAKPNMEEKADELEDEEDTEEMAYVEDEDSSEDEKAKSYFEELSAYIAKII